MQRQDNDKGQAEIENTGNTSELIELLGVSSGDVIGGISGLKLIMPVSVQWNPQPDITAYEMAKLLPLLFITHGIMPSMLPTDEALLRHLIIHDPNAPNDTG